VLYPLRDQGIGAQVALPFWSATPFYPAIPGTFLRFGITVSARWAYLGAADSRIVGVMAPFDPGNLPIGPLRRGGPSPERKLVVTRLIL
jgi:hypothetical protein